MLADRTKDDPEAHLGKAWSRAAVGHHGPEWCREVLATQHTHWFHVCGLCEWTLD